MKISFRGARNSTSCRCIFTGPQMYFFWPTSDSIWSDTCPVHLWILWAVLLANDLVFAMKLHECHESQPSNFPCSNTWGTHEDHHTLPNIVLQLFLGAEMALQTLCGPWLSGPSCSSPASRKLFDLVRSILKHFREWEKKHDSSGYQFGIFWYFNSVTTHTNMLAPKLISAIQLSMPLRQDFVSKSWVWWKWSV